ncbi:hypothetical protein MMC10_002198 [Thelotrema lepadinum]|nr:hypothetical protein [Thelotrema lepadinum]
MSPVGDTKNTFSSTPGGHALYLWIHLRTDSKFMRPWPASAKEGQMDIKMGFTTQMDLKSVSDGVLEIITTFPTADNENNTDIEQSIWSEAYTEGD